MNGPRRCLLAQQIVDEVECPYCLAHPGFRCIVLRGPFNVLTPSASHRSRIELYWALQKAAA